MCALHGRGYVCPFLEDGGGEQMCVVARVHVKRTGVGGTNVCGGEGTCEKDGGGGNKCVWWGGYM